MHVQVRGQHLHILVPLYDFYMHVHNIKNMYCMMIQSFTINGYTWCLLIFVMMHQLQFNPGSIPMSRRQILKHAWAERCVRFYGVSRELPFHNTRDSSRYCNKSTCIPFTTNSWSTPRGCFRKGNSLWWINEICHPFLHTLY